MKNGEKVVDILLAEKSKIYCPICGYKKVYWLKEPDGQTHYCKNCDEFFCCKGSAYIK